MKIQEGIPENKRLEIITWAFEFFKHVTNKEYFFAIVAQETNWDKSIMLVNNDIILGAYLFGDLQINSIIKGTKYDELVGIEGVLLAIDPSIRGVGWGNKLKNYPKILPIDYIWGQQLKTLNNVKDWLKRRELVGETKNVYITAQIF